MIPNVLTLSRLAAAALLPMVFLLVPGGDKIALAVFIFGALTDFIDGFLARKLNRRSQLGAFLDPVADKMLIVSALLVLTADGRAPVVAVIIIICREVAVSALREWAAVSSGGERLSVIAAGKIKTAAQMTAASVLFYNDALWFVGRETVLAAGKGMLWAAAILSVHSFILYALRSRKFFGK
ncbi:MAG: CDP-diacylglycerol--glycerol-3-phosphate 3-phosphatidyltransferase [Gammaproteobacteria bacterium]